MILHSWPTRLVLVVPLIWAGLVQAAESESIQADKAWQAVRAGQAIALIRHALAPGVGDPANRVLGDCSTQRNLSAEGRSQAQHIGDVFRNNGVREAIVLTSQWCRCAETAELLQLGTPQAAPFLDSFFADRSTAEAQTSALRDYLTAAVEAQDAVHVLVTHQVNITALTQQFVNSGEITIMSVNDGAVDVLARISTR